MTSIYCADAFRKAGEFKQQGLKVNHIITDPPYNISKSNHFSHMHRQGIDFGEWDKGFDLTGWIADYAELLDRNGSMIIFCSWNNLSDIIRKLNACDMTEKDLIVWQKSNPMPRNVNRRYVQDREYAIWAVKKKAKWVFNKPEDKPYLRSLFETATVLGKERTKHPTQKSLALMEELIRIHTNEGETVLDPFMGSGTTGVACMKLGRNFIGIEKDQEYFKIASDRINEEQRKENENK